MNSKTTTTAGTAIYEPSPDEYDAYLERRVYQALGKSVSQFRREYAEGQLNLADPAVSQLVPLLIPENGSH
jgi:hypothetical protein